MNAYSLVNNQVRRKLDEMLKTWKEPVPGSLDPRPVFPAETIRPIENALIKARTAAVQAQQQQQSRAQQEMMARSRPMATPNPQWRSTPTPPQARGPYYPPPQQVYSQQSIPNGNYQVYNYLYPFPSVRVLTGSSRHVPSIPRQLITLLPSKLRITSNLTHSHSHSRSRRHIQIISNPQTIQILYIRMSTN